MNCTEHEMMISKLLDGELTQDESAVVFTHLAGCSGCRELYHRMQMLNTSLDRIADRLPDVRVGYIPQFSEQLIRNQPIWNRQVQMRMPVLVMMIMVMILTVGFSIILTTQFSKNETVYVTNLPVVTITADSRTIQSIK